MARKQSKPSSKAVETVKQPFKLKPGQASTDAAKDLVHIIRKGVRCETERRGHKAPGGRTPAEIVLDASEGFIPLWSKNTTLRWRFKESSFQAFENPQAAKAATQKLFADAVLAWGDSAPVKFAYDDDVWDFELVMKNTDDCDSSGCTLAMAFFPDAGRHKLVIYPKMFEQTKKEQIETLVHEIGHIFGLRHFFAQISETAWKSQIFGKHHKFSIMNYGKDSKLTARDKSDLKSLYKQAWAGKLQSINETPIKFVKPYHTISDGSAPSGMAEPERLAAGRGTQLRMR